MKNKRYCKVLELEMLKLCILLWFGCYAATCSKIREHEIKSTRNISSELKTELEEVDPEELDEEGKLKTLWIYS